MSLRIEKRKKKKKKREERQGRNISDARGDYECLE
jgi:hypothetical protein